MSRLHNNLNLTLLLKPQAFSFECLYLKKTTGNLSMYVPQKWWRKVGQTPFTVAVRRHGQKIDSLHSKFQKCFWTWPRPKIQVSISSFHLKFQFQVSVSSLISSFSFKFQFQVSILSFNFKFQFQVSIPSFNFMFQFKVLVSSFNFEPQFQVSVSCFKFQVLI